MTRGKRGGYVYQRGRHSAQRTPHLSYIFDFLSSPESFPAIKEPSDDKSLLEDIMERNQYLTLEQSENFLLMNFTNKVQLILDQLVLQSGSFTGCQLEEVRQIGSFKHGTLIRKPNNVTTGLLADIAVIFKTLPTKEAISQLSLKLLEDLRPLCTEEESRTLTYELTDYGFSIINNLMHVNLFVTTLPKNFNSLDPNLHLDRRICLRNSNAIRHAKWIDDNCVHPSIKVLIRLLKDMRNRFSGFNQLNSWMINLLAHHSVMNWGKDDPLPLSFAFKRILQLLASGIFLPGCMGLQDPCEDTMFPVHLQLSLKGLDNICSTAQTLLRALAFGAQKYILGIETVP
ncbi:unnamed protein product, partial [Didymodactylos carnosus]